MSDSWWHSALCAQTDRELFFVDMGSSGQQAKSVCQRCEVQVPCLIDALGFEQQSPGIFAGFGQHTRQRLTQLIANGADPFDVAVDAVERQRAS